jgi:hypothetical protein
MFSISIALAAPSSNVGTDIPVALRLILVVGHQTVKEGGWWELLLVADNQDMACARNGAQCVFAANLRCIVNDPVKGSATWRQELRH